jgi:hypothetical protein
MAVRETLLLHPRFFYPDVRVHAAMALLVARRGFAELGSAFLESQFRLSLGLQQVGEHWYARSPTRPASTCSPRRSSPCWGTGRKSPCRCWRRR